MKYNIIMAWYLNDFGLYGRRHEMVCKYLAENKRIEKVYHVEPPIPWTRILKYIFLGSILFNKFTFIQGLITMRRIFFPFVRLRNNVFTYTPFLILPEKLSKVFRIQFFNTICLKFQLYIFSKLCRSNNKIILWIYPCQKIIDQITEIVKYDFLCVDLVDDNRHRPSQSGRNDEKYYIANRYEKYAKQADLFLVNNKTLYEEFKKKTKNILLIPNALENIDRIVLDRQKTKKRFNKDYIIIGYSGMINFRLDLDLLDYLIRKGEFNWKYYFIGAVSPIFRDEWKDFIRRHSSKIQWFGPQIYSDMLRLVSNFDVCIMPHIDSKLTRSMDPLKLYNYIALQKPVVITTVSIGDHVIKYVYRAKDKEQFIEMIHSSLNASKSNFNFICSAEKGLKSLSWTARIEEILTKTDKTI